MSAQPLTLAEEKELDRLYLRNRMSAKTQARFETLQERLMQPILAQSYERERRAICEDLETLESDCIAHDPR